MNNITSLLTGMLGLIFITLKLTGSIAWSWLWVLAPFWVPFAVGLAAGIVYLAVLALIFLVSIFLKK